MMRSMWNVGFQAQNFQGVQSQVFQLGQLDLVPWNSAPDAVSKEQRDTQLALLTEGRRQFAAVQAWLNKIATTDYMGRKALGPLYDNFWGYNDLVENRRGTADSNYTILSSPDPSAWTVSQTDLAYGEDWAQSIAQMYEALKRVAPASASLPPAAPPGTKLTPLATGGTILGIPTNQALLGGALAVGVVALIAFFKA